MNKRIAVIGFGRFGRFAASRLSRRASVFAADLRRPRSLPRGIEWVSVEEAAGLPVVVLAVPVRELPALVRRIAPAVQPGALVCDVCSVKRLPLRWMTDELPRGVSVLGTHPLFGPATGQGALRGRTIVVCPAGITSARLERAASFLRRLGLAVVRMTPDAHDRLMAKTLFLTQFLGRSIREMDLPPPGTSTPAYDMLRAMEIVSAGDSAAIFEDMYRFNPHARAVPSRLMSALRKTQSRLVRTR